MIFADRIHMLSSATGMISFARGEKQGGNGISCRENEKPAAPRRERDEFSYYPACFAILKSRGGSRDPLSRARAALPQLAIFVPILQWLLGGLRWYLGGYLLGTAGLGFIFSFKEGLLEFVSSILGANAGAYSGLTLVIEKCGKL